MAKGKDLAERHEQSLRIPGVHYGETELVLPAALDYEQWYQVVTTLGGVTKAVAWWIGDALAHGELAYGELYAQAEAALGYDQQTLMNYVYVARHVSGDRRRPELSWSHHQAVASLDGDKQTYYLNAAAEGSWSRNQLREALATDGHVQRRALPATPGHAAAVAVVEAAAVLPPPPAASAPAAQAPAATDANPFLALDGAARLVTEGALAYDAVPAPLQAGYVAVPRPVLAALEEALVAVDAAALVGGTPAVATADLVPTDDYPCSNDPPCAYVAGTQEELWAHLRTEHGWT